MSLSYIKKLFEKNSNPEAAEKMAAYMRNQFAFYGIKAPLRRELSKDIIKKSKKSDIIDWQFIFSLYTLDQREYQYLALDILKAGKNLLTMDDFDRLLDLAGQKPWWDTIDNIDTLLGSLEADDFKEKILALSTHTNYWYRRIAIDHQRGKKEKTDANLLGEIIKNNLGKTYTDKDEEFFINKAIGWALREYSKTNPVWVKDFLNQNQRKLASLSIREASKYI